MDDYPANEEKVECFDPRIVLSFLGGAVVGLVVWALLYLYFGYPDEIGGNNVPSSMRSARMTYWQYLLEYAGIFLIPLLFSVYSARAAWRSMAKPYKRDNLR